VHSPRDPQDLTLPIPLPRAAFSDDCRKNSRLNRLARERLCSLAHSDQNAAVVEFNLGS
jgi:hypothetical protein